MLSWDDLQYLLAFRRYGSLGAAAKALGLNKSTVGRRVAALEEGLGVKLLERGPTGYRVTAAGRAAIATGERIERLVNELVAEVGDVDRAATGTVRVTVPAWFAQHIIIPGLPALRKAHPSLDVHLITTDEILDLGRREADIAIRNVRPTQHSLVMRKGGDIAFAMYASCAYANERGLPDRREAFHGHALVAYQTAVAHVEAYRWANELRCPVAFRATDTVSMLDAVAAGLGIGVLPCLIANLADDLVCLEAVGGPRPETIWLVTHADTREIERVRIVSRWVGQLFEDHADALAGRCAPSREAREHWPPPEGDRLTDSAIE